MIEESKGSEKRNVFKFEEDIKIRYIYSQLKSEFYRDGCEEEEECK